MKKLAYFIGIFILVNSYAYADDRCSNLVGSWQGEIYNYEKDYRDIFIDIFNPDGTFRSHYEGQSLSGIEENDTIDIGKNIEEGTWTCQGDTFIMITMVDSGIKHEPVDKIYKIIELTDTYLKYQTIKGHSKGLIYESYKSDKK